MSNSSWKPGNPVHLETNRFLLRSMSPQLVNEEYISWWNDERVQQSLNFQPRNWSHQQAVRHVSKFNNANSFHIGVFRKGTNELAAFIAIFLNPQSMIATLNIVIGNKKFWGTNLPKETSSAIFSFVFDTLGARKTRVEVNSNNRSSLRMVSDLGFIEEGILRNEVSCFSGGYLNKHLFGMLAEDWREKQKIDEQIEPK